MADYTVAQLLAAYRQDHPALSQVDDNSLIRAIGQDSPDLIKGATGFKAEPVAEQPGAMSRFLTSAKDAVTGTASGLYHAATDPMTESEKTSGFSLLPGLTAAKRVLIDPQLEQLKKARDSYSQGNYSEAVGHGLAGVVPGIGPAAANVAEQAGTGDIAGAAGTGAAYLGMAKVAQKAGKVIATPPEVLQDTATRARMYGAAHPSVLDPLKKSQTTIGALANLPEAGRGIAGAVGTEVVAPALDRVAKAKIALGATPRAATYEPTNAVLPVEEQLQQSGVRVPEQPPAEAPAPVEESIMQPAMEPAVPPHIQRVADALIRRGRGAGGADLALTNAQHLLEIMPEVRALSDVPDATGISPFDKAITNRLNTVGHEIGTKLAQEAVGKMVDTTDASFQLEELSKQASAYGDSTLGNKILKLSQTLDQSGMTDAAQVITTRQQMFDSALDISTGLGHDVYQIFKDLSEKIAPGIKDLNKKYFTLKTSAELGEIRTGGISPESQMGAGTRPKADYRDRVAAEGDAEKDAGKAATKAKADKAAEIRRQQKYAEQPKGFKMGPL